MRKYLSLGLVVLLGTLSATYIGEDGLEYPDNPIEEQNTVANSFLALPLHKKDKETIYKIISRLGDRRLDELFADRKKMEERGNQVNHVHPLRFVGYIFSDPALRTCLRKVRESSFKWTSFIDGYSGRMKEEYYKNNLERHVPGFSEFVGVDPESVLEFVQAKNYEGLIIYLLENTN